MANIETEGIVLRSYNLSDADKIVVFLTLDYGLVKGVAKGAKRLKSKFGSAIEPFSIVNLAYFQKEEKELVHIKNIELIRSYLREASQLEFFSKFEYAAELLSAFVPLNDPNSRLYNMSKVCLETASENIKELECIIVYFEIWILKLCGFLPSWEQCNQCRQIFAENDQANFQFDYHITCINCQNGRQNNPISPVKRNIYNFAQKSSPSNFIEFAKNKSREVNEVSLILKRLISNVLGTKSVGEKILTVNNNY